MSRGAGSRPRRESSMGSVRLEPGMAGWSSRLDLDRLAERVEEMRQRLVDHEQLLEYLQSKRRRVTAASPAAGDAETAGDLAAEVEHLRISLVTVISRRGAN